MHKPRALAAGDRIAIVAPASPFDRNEFDRGVDEIKRLGFVPTYDESVFARRAYLAGSPEVRAAAFQAAWDDPAIAGVIAARGGYGSAQILPLLDARAVRLSAKCFVGYSDITAMPATYSVASENARPRDTPLPPNTLMVMGIIG